MRRKIDSILDDWMARPDAPPLLLRGARRVGKTYALKALGDRSVDPEQFAYCDFQTNRDTLDELFSGPTEVDQIVDNLSLYLRKPIVAHQSLIAFDEIQLSEKALNSLRFFAHSPYRVIATGSQLGITLNDRSLPFPSDITHLHLKPLDFEEFLWALDEEAVARGIRRSFEALRPFPLHQEALRRYREYLAVGGMPKVVEAYRHSSDFSEVRTLQAEINETYTADIALYAPAPIASQAHAIWNSLPSQLSREPSRKFKYSDVVRGGRRKNFENPLAWLSAAELITINYQTNDHEAPLFAREDGSFFKVYLADTGLLFYRYNLDARTLLEADRWQQLSSRFRGALTENYVMQALVANGLTPFYWVSKTGPAHEVEFLLQNRFGELIPLEAKSSHRVKSPSLNAYLEKSRSTVGLRASTKNFGREGQLISLPLYGVFCLDEQALMTLPSMMNDMP